MKGWDKSVDREVVGSVYPASGESPGILQIIWSCITAIEADYQVEQVTGRKDSG